MRLICPPRTLRRCISLGLAVGAVKLSLAASTHKFGLCLRDMCSTNEPLIDLLMPTKIRIAAKSDPDKVYQLLDTAARQPELLSSITEATVKLKQVEEGWVLPTFTNHSQPYEETERSRPLAPDHALRPLLQTLHLQGDVDERSYSDDQVLRLLTWQDPSVSTARDAQIHADGLRRNLDMYLNYMNDSFLNFAAPVVLMHCPNIETLSYSACPPSPFRRNHDTVYKQHLLRSTLLRNNYGKLAPQHLQRLKHVHLHAQQGSWWIDDRDYTHIDLLGEIRLFHRLPSIESISVEYVSRNGGADALECFPPKTSNIKRIHVRHSMLDEYAPLIRMSRSLEEFTYTVGGRSSTHGGFYSVTGKTFGKALWDQRASLRRLDLDVDSVLLDDQYDDDQEADWLEQQEDLLHDPYWYDEWFKMDEQDSAEPLHVWELPDTRAYNSSIGHLRDFEQLTHLSIGVRLLLGPPETETPFRLVDALPPSLESLHIRGYVRGEAAKYDEAIDELMDGRSVKLPALRDIRGVLELIPSAKWDSGALENDDGDVGDGREAEDDDVVWEQA